MRPRSRLPRGALIATGPVVLVLVGIAGYLSFGYSPWMAAAMTLLTLTTVGFAPGAHLSTGELVFTAGLALLGVGLFVVILGLAATAIVEGRVSLISRSRRMRRRLDELRGHFIVCAYGRVGRAIAGELEAEGVPFVVVDSKAELEPDLERDGRCYLIGDASDEAVLRKAGIERAQALICAVDSDAENVFITIVARSLSPNLLIVARAAREQSADRLHRAGATRVVSPYVTSGRRMANLALRPHVVEFFDIAGAGRARPAARGTGDHRRVPAGGPHPAGDARADGAVAGPPPQPAADRQPGPRPSARGPVMCWSSLARPTTCIRSTVTRPRAAVRRGERPGKQDDAVGARAATEPLGDHRVVPGDDADRGRKRRQPSATKAVVITTSMVATAPAHAAAGPHSTAAVIIGPDPSPRGPDHEAV